MGPPALKVGVTKGVVIQSWGTKDRENRARIDKDPNKRTKRS